MVAARHLSNRGYNVTVVLTGAETKLKSIPSKQWNILKKLPITMIMGNSSDYLGVFKTADIIIDAVIGYGMKGDIRGVPANIIHEILNSQNPNVLSLDAPSGLNTATGYFSEGLCIRAHTTMTLALPKTGLMQENSKECVGDYMLLILVFRLFYINQLELIIKVYLTNYQLLKLTRNCFSYFSC